MLSSRASDISEHDRAIGTDTQRLSRRAIEIAYKMTELDEEAVQRQLYFYNRLPLGPERRARFPDSFAVARFLDSGCRHGSRARANAIVEIEPSRHWRHWVNRATKRIARHDPIYKLYVSTMVEDLPRALNCVLSGMPSWGALSAKIGKDIPDLLRPDKLVVYFSSADRLAAAAGDLSRQLKGVSAHSVPFTFELPGAPFLSTGRDLPSNRLLASVSWRMTVTSSLAAAIVTNRHRGFEDDMTFIDVALRKAGIDPIAWKPLGTPP